MRRTTATAILIAASAFVPACSISESVSDSVNAALESVSNSLESISDSSTSGGGESAMNYQRDVYSETLAWLDRGESDADESGELLRALGRAAERHGMTDWTKSPATRAALRDVVEKGGYESTDLARLREELALLGPEMVDAAFAPRRPEVAAREEVAADDAR